METLYCPYCDFETLHTRGLCTGCIRKEENRRAGVLWLICGVPVLTWGLLGFAIPDMSFGIQMVGGARNLLISGCTIVVGLILTGRGALMVIRGTPAPS